MNVQTEYARIWQRDALCLGRCDDCAKHVVNMLLDRFHLVSVPVAIVDHLSRQPGGGNFVRIAERQAAEVQWLRLCLRLNWRE